MVEGGEERCALQVVGGRAAARHGGRTREGDEEATNAAPLPRLAAEVWEEHLRRVSVGRLKSRLSTLSALSARAALFSMPPAPLPRPAPTPPRAAPRPLPGGGRRSDEGEERWEHLRRASGPREQVGRVQAEAYVQSRHERPDDCRGRCGPPVGPCGLILATH